MSVRLVAHHARLGLDVFELRGPGEDHEQRQQHRGSDAVQRVIPDPDRQEAELGGAG